VKCLGFDEQGNYFDCPNEAGTLRTKRWCPECDDRRVAHMASWSAALIAAFPKEEADPLPAFHTETLKFKR
jgi:hypothetical protein